MFKLVCGAGNEDYESVKRLVYTYARAGCKMFDISAKKEILEAGKEGASMAGCTDVHFCVSIGIKGDPHINKAEINPKVCIKCATCLRNCPNEAVSQDFSVNHNKCIGCGKCARNCPTGAMQMKERDINPEKILPYMVENGVDILELHVTGQDTADLEYKWGVINQCNPKMASICIDRQNLGNRQVLERIRSMLVHRKPYTTIVQADGIPMSGNEDDYKTTLQAAAMAQIIDNAKLPVYLMVSGGTNSKTAELCRLCGVNYSGIAIGSWARKIIREYIKAPDFWENSIIMQNAVDKASELVSSCFDKEDKELF